MSQLTAPGGDDRPVYQWLPESSASTPADSASWLPPPGPVRPVTPPQHSPTAPRQQRRRREGAAGGILAAIFAFLKYGLVLVKFGTFGPTLITMVIAIWFYTLFFGPAFAIGIVVLILVHELGHFIVARGMGLPARLPIFIGPLGAVTSLRGRPADAGKSGIIALAGPALGTVAALLCFLLASTAPVGYARYLLLALAFFGCFLNLINLIPVGFLDGAKVADAIPGWMNVAGLLVVAGVVLLFGNPIGLIFLILGIFHTIGRFRRSSRGGDPSQLAASRRLGLGTAYIAILLVAAGGMSVANTAIVNSNFVPGISQSTGTRVL
ncbi:MAG TPA: site-2 protease family protein [Candidatus Dormibacteraeota bacterium]|jgi:Zn-dependent protease